MTNFEKRTIRMQFSNVKNEILELKINLCELKSLNWKDEEPILEKLEEAYNKVQEAKEIYQEWQNKNQN